MQKTDVNNNNTALAIVVIATAVVLIGGLAVTVPYSQTAAADKDCSVGRTLKESKPDNWGQLLSEQASTTNGVGDAFSGANAICHAD
jgi:hypothetical protein